jgi:predicted acylesterase/phospholipase RssA
VETVRVIVGRGRVKRVPRDQAYLLQQREANERAIQATRQTFVEFLQHIKFKHDEHAAGRRSDPESVDLLILSGGGDWGAFGAGFLKGWGKVPKNDPMARPEFDLVTGVSTGALIAPFAFLGKKWIDHVVNLYRNPDKDWVKPRWPLYFLPNNLSFAEVPGLERALRKTVTPQMAAEIADAGKDGRILVVNTTNLDDSSPRVFFLVPEAQRASETGDMSRMHEIMLASAGVPGVLPYREIDGEMYVDGGVTGNIIYGGRFSEEDSLIAIWQELYPDVPIPKFRFWVIFNNQLRKAPTVVPARWLDIITRSLEQATRSSSITGIRHLYAMAEISRLKRTADTEVRVVAIPDDWSATVEGTFAKETMNELADIGEEMGANPSCWVSQLPR